MGQDFSLEDLKPGTKFDEALDQILHSVGKRIKGGSPSTADGYIVYTRHRTRTGAPTINRWSYGEEELRRFEAENDGFPIPATAEEMLNFDKAISLHKVTKQKKSWARSISEGSPLNSLRRISAPGRPKFIDKIINGASNLGKRYAEKQKGLKLDQSKFYLDFPDDQCEHGSLDEAVSVCSSDGLVQIDPKLQLCGRCRLQEVSSAVNSSSHDALIFQGNVCSLCDEAVGERPNCGEDLEASSISESRSNLISFSDEISVGNISDAFLEHSQNTAQLSNSGSESLDVPQSATERQQLQQKELDVKEQEDEEQIRIIPGYVRRQCQVFLQSSTSHHGSPVIGKKIQRSSSDLSGSSSLKSLNKRPPSPHSDKGDKWTKNFNLARNTKFTEAVMAKGYVKALAEQINIQGALITEGEEEGKMENSDKDELQFLMSFKDDNMRKSLVHDLILAAEQHQPNSGQENGPKSASTLKHHSSTPDTPLSKSHRSNAPSNAHNKIPVLKSPLKSYGDIPNPQGSEISFDLMTSGHSHKPVVQSSMKTTNHLRKTSFSNEAQKSSPNTSPKSNAQQSSSSPQSLNGAKPSLDLNSKPKIPPKKFSLTPDPSTSDVSMPRKSHEVQSEVVSPSKCEFPISKPISSPKPNILPKSPALNQPSTPTWNKPPKSPRSPDSNPPGAPGQPKSATSQFSYQSPSPTSPVLSQKTSSTSPTSPNSTARKSSNSKQAATTVTSPTKPQPSPSINTFAKSGHPNKFEKENSKPKSETLSNFHAASDSENQSLFESLSKSEDLSDSRNPPISEKSLNSDNPENSEHLSHSHNHANSESPSDSQNSLNPSSSSNTPTPSPFVNNQPDEVTRRVVSKRSSAQYRDSVINTIYDNGPSLNAAELFDSSWSDSDSFEDFSDDDENNDTPKEKKKQCRSQETVPEPIVQEQPEVPLADKRYKIASELLQTEKDYVARLGLLHETFYLRLEEENKQQTFLQVGILKQMFSNIKSIYLFHHDFLLPQLKERIENWVSDPRIGDLMKKNAPFLKMYTEYIRNFDNAMKLINQWMEKSSKFSEIIQEIQKRPECGSLSLQHHMLGPIQRVPRYELLLKDYVKHLPENSPDKTDSKDALDLVTKAACHSNEAMKKIETFHKLLDIYQSLRGVPVDFISPTREFVIQGPVTKISARSGEKQPRQIFLFNDLVLVCTQYNLLGTFNVRSLLEVDSLEIKQGNNMHIPNTFMLRSKQKAVELLDENANGELFGWEMKISEVITTYKQRKRCIKHEEVPAYSHETNIPESCLGKTAPIWIPDDAATMCMLCQITFNMVRRRHHCRSCGKLICKSCCKKAPLEYKKGKIERVCASCYEVIVNKKGSNELDNEASPKKKGVLQVKASEPGLIHGYLQCSEDGGHSWQKLWVVAHQDFVLYSFKAHEDVSAVGSLPLPGYTVEAVRDLEGKHHVFAVKHKNKRVCLYQTENERHVKRWVHLLEKLVKAELPDASTRLSSLSNSSNASSVSDCAGNNGSGSESNNRNSTHSGSQADSGYPGDSSNSLAVLAVEDTDHENADGLSQYDNVDGVVSE